MSLPPLPKPGEVRTGVIPAVWTGGLFFFFGSSAPSSQVSPAARTKLTLQPRAAAGVEKSSLLHARKLQYSRETLGEVFSMKAASFETNFFVLITQRGLNDLPAVTGSLLKSKSLLLLCSSQNPLHHLLSYTDNNLRGI